MSPGIRFGASASSDASAAELSPLPPAVDASFAPDVGSGGRAWLCCRRTPGALPVVDVQLLLPHAGDTVRPCVLACCAVTCLTHMRMCVCARAAPGAAGICHPALAAQQRRPRRALPAAAGLPHGRAAAAAQSGGCCSRRARRGRRLRGARVLGTARRAAGVSLRRGATVRGLAGGGVGRSSSSAARAAAVTHAAARCDGCQRLCLRNCCSDGSSRWRRRISRCRQQRSGTHWFCQSTGGGGRRDARSSGCGLGRLLLQP